MTTSIHHTTNADQVRHYLNPLHIRVWLRPLVGKYLARVIALGYQSFYNLTLGV